MFSHFYFLFSLNRNCSINTFSKAYEAAIKSILLNMYVYNLIYFIKIWSILATFANTEETCLPTLKFTTLILATLDNVETMFYCQRRVS